MSDSHMKRSILPWAIGLLAFILAYVWITDKPMPAYGGGRFWSVVIDGAVVAVLVTGAVAYWRGVRDLWRKR